MAAKPKPNSTYEVMDYSGLNMFALVCAVILIIAFIFMPWIGSRLADNGARLMSDVLYGAIGANETIIITLIPLMALLSGGLSLWGISRPDSAYLATRLTTIPGVVGLIYFASIFLNIADKSPVHTVGAGSGFWVSLFCMLGLALQPWFAQPNIHYRISGGSSTLSSKIPAVPRSWIPYLFLFFPLMLYLVWVILPTAYTFYLSLTKWEGFGQPEYIGLKNFEKLFGLNGRRPDKDFILALKNNVRWLAVFITVPTTLGLGLAMIFNTEIRGSRWYKVGFFAPLVLSLPVIGLVWLWLYNPEMGLINSMLREVGVQDPPGWHADRSIAIWCVIFAAVWRQVGYVMVLYLAGLKNIDPTLIDAAMVDGAGRWPMFRKVIFPLLAPVTTIIVVISVIDSLRAFDLVQVMTRGNQDTEVLANMMYIEAFNNYKMGYGAAIAVVLFGISLVFIGFYLSRVVKDELEY
jgi:ABC-type sugar transport system permease subunit